MKKGKVIVIIAVIAAAVTLYLNKELRDSVVSAAKPHAVEHLGTPEEKLSLAVTQFYEIMGQEDMEKLPDLISETSREKVLEKLRTTFADYDLKYTIISRENINIADDGAVMDFVLETVRVNGKRFRNKRETGVLTMKLVEGKWLFDSFEVKEITYLI